MGPDLMQIFGSYMPWRLDEKTWIISFMNGSEYMYLLEGEEKALLIDTGWGAGNLRQFVERLTDKPIIVVNSHFHPDHAAGNGEFEKVYMSKGAPLDAYTVEGIGDDRQSLAPFDIKKLPHPDYERIYIDNGFTFDLGERKVEVIVPKIAHSSSSLIFIDKGHRMLFTGDEFESMQANMFNDPIGENGVLKTGEILLNYRDNAKMLWEMRDEFDYVLPNHNGTPIAKDYILQSAELVDEVLAGTALIEDKLNHPFIEHDPKAPRLCRVRHKNVSIFVYKDELMEIYGTQK